MYLKMATLYTTCEKLGPTLINVDALYIRAERVCVRTNELAMYQWKWNENWGQVKIIC